jgi:hypothetical protein
MLENLVLAAVNDLVHLQRVDGAFFVNLPMVTPDGSFVTVRVEQAPGGVRVSDNGFAYREAEDVGMHRSFTRAANRLAAENGVEVRNRAICIEVALPQIHRAICDVAEVSWKVMDHVCRRAFDDDEEDLAGDLTDRLKSIFGEKVSPSEHIVGTSTTEWQVSALVRFPDHFAVFQAVSKQPNSVYRASTAFRDLAGLEQPPRLIAFVRDKEEIGKRLSLLAPGKVIETSQPSELLYKAAA